MYICTCVHVYTCICGYVYMYIYICAHDIDVLTSPEISLRALSCVSSTSIEIDHMPCLESNISCINMVAPVLFFPQFLGFVRLLTQLASALLPQSEPCVLFHFFTSSYGVKSWCVSVVFAVFRCPGAFCPCVLVVCCPVSHCCLDGVPALSPVSRCPGGVPSGVRGITVSRCVPVHQVHCRGVLFR